MRAASFVAAMVLAVASPATAAGDPEVGKKAFAKCSACHAVTAGSNGAIAGLSLAGVVGHPAAAVPGFDYSTALKNANITWSAEALDAFLANPRRMVPNTRQPIAVTNATERANIIAYLETLK
jgi:cytochrome c